MKKSFLAIAMAVAIMPFAFAGQQNSAPAANSGTTNNSTTPTTKTKKVKKHKAKKPAAGTAATPSK